MDVELESRAREWAAGSDHRMLIGGELVAARGNRLYQAIDPSTNAVIGLFPDADGADVEAAIVAAEAARSSWARRAGHERVSVVRAMADIIEENLDEIAALDSIDTGVPLWMMRKDVVSGISRMRMFADWALRLVGETIPSTPSHLTYTERVPFGIVARIVAYNHPSMFGISKIAAPLIAGNAVILKPSQLTPVSMCRVAELWADIVPAGVLSILSGATSSPGEQLVRDPRIRRVAFTGSPTTGRAIQRGAAELAVKHVSLELGGKNALIVLPDADLDAVAAGAVSGMNLAFAGQSCGSTSRLLVPRALLDDVVALVEERFRGIRIGTPFEPEVQMSPLISDLHCGRVGSSVDAALAATGRLVTGGSRPEHRASGNFFAPTLIVDDDFRSPVATQEIFGPVLTVIPTDDTEQAVEIANSLPYGLTAGVYGSDVGRALDTARRLEAGYVWINETSTHFAGMPFGGVKDSGVGREESFEELLDYTQLRATSVRLG